jgi:hypothetical protein
MLRCRAPKAGVTYLASGTDGEAPPFESVSGNGIGTYVLRGSMDTCDGFTGAGHACRPSHRLRTGRKRFGIDRERRSGLPRIS